MQAYNIITDEDNIKIYVKELLNEAIERKKTIISRKSKEFIQWRNDIVKNLQDRYVRLVMAVSQNKIKLPNKVRNSRNYNLLTEVSLDLIELIANAFDKEIVEVDIVSCNPRIIYAFCGLQLPDDFYGENKKNKKAINKILNKISIDFPTDFNISIPLYKKKRIEELRILGFNEIVIAFLFKEFWNKEKDALFNFCSYHEKNIIERLQNQFKEKDTSGNYIRRHDSVISFSKLHESQIEDVNSFEYLEQSGWFHKLDMEAVFTDEKISYELVEN